jgi:tetratricopeptide (TPR) repeat protein
MALARGRNVETVDPEAYDRYLRGRLYQNRLLEIEPDLYRAVSQFRRSLEEDPSFAPAHARIALAFAILGAFNIIAPDSAWPNMERAAEMAVALDPESADSQLALGVARYQRWRWEEAEEALSAALEANPNDVDALHWNALYHQLHMNEERALELVRRAANLEPEDPWTMGRVAWPLIGMGRWNEGVEILQAVLEDYPEYGLGYWNLAVGLTGRGDIEDALKAIQSAMNYMEPDDLGDEYGLLGNLLAQVGRTDEAREQLANLDRLEATGRFVSPVSRSLVYAGLGEEERALELLEEGFESRSGWLHFAMNAPYWAHLHSHPRYIQLRQRLGLPPRN